MSPAETEAMVLDIRIYKVRAGTRAAFHKLVRDETVPMAQASGQQIVDFGPSAHGDDIYYLIRAFPSPAERARTLANFYGGEEWQKKYDARVMAFIEAHQVAVVATTAEIVRHLTEAGQANRARAARAIRAHPDDATIVAALDTEYQAAVERNDAETMDRILADDFVLITGSGKTYDKADLLNEARSGKTVYDHQHDTERYVRVWGDTAVVTALLSAKGSTAGEPFDYKLWFSDTYVRTSHGWRYVLGHASTRIANDSR